MVRGWIRLAEERRTERRRKVFLVLFLIPTVHGGCWGGNAAAAATTTSRTGLLITRVSWSAAAELCWKTPKSGTCQVKMCRRRSRRKAIIKHLAVSVRGCCARSFRYQMQIKHSRPIIAEHISLKFIARPSGDCFLNYSCRKEKNVYGVPANFLITKMDYTAHGNQKFDFVLHFFTLIHAPIPIYSDIGVQNKKVEIRSVK